MTPSEITRAYNTSLDSVNLINLLLQKPTLTEQELSGLNGNASHLRIMIAKDFWTTQDLAPLRAAVNAASVATVAVLSTAQGLNAVVAEVSATLATERDAAVVAKATAESALTTATIAHTTAITALESAHTASLTAKDAEIAALQAQIAAYTPPAPTGTVTMRQARLALLQAGKYSMVSQAIASMPEPDKTAATIEWEYASTVERSSAFVASMAAALGLTDTEMDNLCALAASL